MADHARTLFELMPDTYRRRDRAAGGALEAFLNAVEDERRLIARDIDRMYDNWFAETADDDGLRGIATLFGTAEGSAPSRPSVTDAIACRRRKGVAAAATRWITAETGWIAELHETDQEGRENACVYNIWRSAIYPVEFAEALHLGDGRYTVNPFGLDVPLYRAPKPRYDIDAPFTAQNAPAPLLAADLGDLRVCRVTRDGDGEIVDGVGLIAVPWPIDEAEMRGAVLDGVFVDPETGRLFDPFASPNSALYVSYAYAFSGDVGGGPYFRDAGTHTGAQTWIATVSKLGMTADGRVDAAFTDLGAALAAFRRQGGDGVIRILDSGAYDLGADGWLGGPPDACAGAFSAARRLDIVAAEAQTPVLRGEIVVNGAEGGAEVTLSGLWIEGPILLGADASLRLSHATINPCAAGPSLILAPYSLGATVSKSILGPVQIDEPNAGLRISDSIIDAQGGEAALGTVRHETFERTTILGVLQTQPPDDHGNLIVDLRSGEDERLVMSTTFGRPDYCRVSLSADTGRTGLSTPSGERGAFRFLDNAGRIRRLNQAMQDYSPAGLTPRWVDRAP